MSDWSDKEPVRRCNMRGSPSGQHSLLKGPSATDEDFNHPDARREHAYNRTAKSSELDKGLDEANTKGWLVIDMQDNSVSVSA
jgi:hypothetical protein